MLDWDGLPDDAFNAAPQQGGAFVIVWRDDRELSGHGEPRYVNCDTFSYTRVVIAPGPTTGRSFRGTGIHAAATKPSRQSVVGRLFDVFDEDASGVSALQQSDVGDRSRPLPCRRQASEGGW